MVSISRQILVILITIGIVYFYQYYDDKKYDKKRTNWWEKLKLPLLMSSIVYFSLNLKMLKQTSVNEIQNSAIDNMYTEMAKF